MRSSRLFLALALVGALVLPALGEENAPLVPALGERPVFAQTGTATYYGGRIVGHPTANGERLARHGLTAAHRTLPFGTVVRVTNIGNGRVVKVRINDRGPYIRRRARRILDLSTDAAAALGIARCGVAKVKIEELVSDQRA
jgi:rare lipoprotein A